ncbi:MAG: GAF domain-containing protein [Bacteroidota bacterium]
MPAYNYPVSLIPDDDAQRLLSLYQCGMLDTPEEESFDRVARLAALIFNAPASFINFVDERRVFFKSNNSNFPTRSIDRKDSLCSLTILKNEPTVFEDTHAIPQLLASPYVSCEGGIRFYAGAPLIMPDGHRVGTVCVIDSEPRLIIPRQLQMLETLSHVITEKLILQMTISKMEKSSLRN